ncbi:MAG: HEAT repeat domain-containing protein, partial [Bryobacteraceae bacterium]
EAAQLASALDPRAAPQLARMLGDRDSGVRYWGALGLLMRGPKAAAAHRDALATALTDHSPAVRIAAAEALGRYGSNDDVRAAMAALVPLCHPGNHGAYAALEALNAVDALGLRARPWLAEILAMPDEDPKAPERVRSEYIRRMRERLQRASS